MQVVFKDTKKLENKAEILIREHPYYGGQEADKVLA